MAIVEDLKRDDPAEIGPYRLLARLGTGSFGTVYAAWERDHQDQLAAVKVGHDEYSEHADFPISFGNEIATIRKVQSDFVPKLLQAKADDEPAWMATELIPGPSLEQIVRWCGRLPEETVRHLGVGIVEALAAIHGCGIAHRDLRPKNVLLVSTGPWVIDFNLAHVVHLGYHEAYQPHRADPGYMSQEEVGHDLREAKMPADVFALGATLVYAATGHPPFDENNQAGRTGARPNLDGLPRRLRDLMNGCLLYASSRPSLDELRRDLGRRAGSFDRNGFAATLPPEVVARLEEHRDALAEKIGRRGPARLGWYGIDSDGASSPSAVRTRWTSQLDSWISGAASVDGGRLAVNCLDGTIAVLDTDNGRPPAGWREPVDVGAALHAAPLLLAGHDGRGTIYAGTADGLVYAVDLTSGRNRVVIEAGAAIEAAPVVAGDRLYALGADGRVHAADPRTGQDKVLFEMDGAATGAMSCAAGTIFAADTGGRLYAVDMTTGQENWQVTTGGLVVCAALPVGDRVYVCGTDGVLREIEIANGRQRTADVGASVHAAPTCDGNLLYVAGSDGLVHGYAVADRDSAALIEVWQFPLGEEIAGLAASGGRVYVTAGYRLVEVVRGTRHSRELLRMKCLIGAPPVISERRCYVTGLGGIVTCLEVTLSL